MAAVMEVDLTACHPSTLVDRINAMPALKTSAAFFSFLRANLILPPSEMASNASTPVFGPITRSSSSATGRRGHGVSTTAPTTTAAPAGASAAASGSTTTTGTANNNNNTADGSAVSLDDIPPLSLGVLTARTDKVDALQLVADSVAQQRQVASHSLVRHPLNVAGLVLTLAAAYQLSPQRDLGTMLSLLSGVVMTYLLGIRYVTAPYLRLAEDVRWDFLTKKRGRNADHAVPTSAEDKDMDEDKNENENENEEDTVVGARFGDELIGALVLHLEPFSAAAAAAAAADPASSDVLSPPPSRKRSHSRGTLGNNNNNNNSSSSSYSHGHGHTNATSGNINNPLKGGHGVIRAWTTKLRYRRRGVGTDLLQEAVRVTRERCGKDAAVGFAREHANSTMVLAAMYNSAFRANERRATETLDKVLAEWSGNKRKR
ncbi:gcn5-related n-acetyltransferase [Niveomyces insectorum RCEF 264]|uniref:Gcn5-related n-acetyltransferase n=1 Tax=Niveomyces insectorum RCEF 264 TaxID=1081102 RepID=A0A162LBU0_9HYPO|nr:gcn5-related n-acetyltransferase [Niveomyces insectorum RCEF 264]